MFNVLHFFFAVLCVGVKMCFSNVPSRKLLDISTMDTSILLSISEHELK